MFVVTNFSHYFLTIAHTAIIRQAAEKQASPHIIAMIQLEGDVRRLLAAHLRPDAPPNGLCFGAFTNHIPTILGRRHLDTNATTRHCQAVADDDACAIYRSGFEHIADQIVINIGVVSRLDPAALTV